jgi:hypothetical protein
MNVNVIEAASGKSVCIISLKASEAPAGIETEYFNEAWCCVVDDGLVDVHHQDDYRFVLEA